MVGDILCTWVFELNAEDDEMAEIKEKLQRINKQRTQKDQS